MLLAQHHVYVYKVVVLNTHFQKRFDCARFLLKQMWRLTKAIAEMKRQHRTKYGIRVAAQS